MSSLTTADVRRLAINVLRDAAESRKMPSCAELDEATAGRRADAAETLEATLADLRDHE